jgi:hypothetical protein
VSQHGREHEELLAALLAGELAATDPRAVELLAGCERCRASFSALRDVAAQLARAASAQEEDRAAIESAPPAPGEELVLARLEELAPVERRSSRRLWGLAAAAALLFACLWLVRAFVGEEPRETWLHEQDLHLIEPLDGARSFERFTWKYDKDASSYTLTIYAGADAGGTRLVEIPKWKESTWTSDKKTLTELPGRIYWEVQAFDAFGQPLAARGTAASLSSR